MRFFVNVVNGVVMVMLCDNLDCVDNLILFCFNDVFDFIKCDYDGVLFDGYDIVEVWGMMGKCGCGGFCF